MDLVVGEKVGLGVVKRLTEVPRTPTKQVVRSDNQGSRGVDITGNGGEMKSETRVGTGRVMDFNKTDSEF